MINPDSHPQKCVTIKLNVWLIGFESTILFQNTNESGLTITTNHKYMRINTSIHVKLDSRPQEYTTIHNNPIQDCMTVLTSSGIHKKMDLRPQDYISI